MTCWQRPEDMNYDRPVSECTGSASDLAAEMAAALASASIVFRQDQSVARNYSQVLVGGAQKLYEFATEDGRRGSYSTDHNCFGNAANFYNSSGYLDELVWGSLWLFYATGNWSYLQSVTEGYNPAVQEQQQLDNRPVIFDWNSKLVATQILLTRLRYLLDPGQKYDNLLKSCSDATGTVMCAYLPNYGTFERTPGGLVLLNPNNDGPALQYAATAAFLSKLYIDYLATLGVPGWSCGPDFLPSKALLDFSMSQIDYILGKNPLNMSYVVGFGENYPTRVHHRAASIPAMRTNRQNYGCKEGLRWLNESAPNPNILNGSMVAGPDNRDEFHDNRMDPRYTEPNIAANAGLIAALVALSSPISPPRGDIVGLTIDPHTIFSNIPSAFPSPPSPPPPWHPY